MALSKSDMNLAKEYAGLASIRKPASASMIDCQRVPAFAWTDSGSRDTDRLLAENPELPIPCIAAMLTSGRSITSRCFLYAGTENRPNNPDETPWMKPLLRSINAIAAE